MTDTHKISVQTYIGYVHLKIADFNRSLEFYFDLVAFEGIKTNLFLPVATSLRVGHLHLKTV